MDKSKERRASLMSGDGFNFNPMALSRHNSVQTNEAECQTDNEPIVTKEYAEIET